MRTDDEERLFFQALSLENPEEQTKFLENVCSDDPALMARIKELLKASQMDHPLFAEPAAHDAKVGVDIPEEPPAETSGRDFEQLAGKYVLLEELGEGGFGTVFLAEQKRPVQRRVAVKIIKPGMQSKEVLARFEAERQTLAMMNHPNIAKVFDGGITDSGCPFFVMELISGETITDYCDQIRLSTVDRIRLFILVCDAVHHAHQKGIIHRDLKPSNVMVTLENQTPVPKVIDFGVAKALDPQLSESAHFTTLGQLIGTPAYMSPEQAEMNNYDIDIRSDVFSLGILLYQLITGTTPLDSEELRKQGVSELQRRIRDEVPQVPSKKISSLGRKELTRISENRSSDPVRLVKEIQNDLDWIILKALEKEPADRYQSVYDLNSDLKRFLAFEPIEARPHSLAYKMQKAFQRNAKALVPALILVILLAGAAILDVALMLEANATARQELYYSLVRQAGSARNAGHYSQVASLLQRCPPSLVGWEWEFLNACSDEWKRRSIFSGKGTITGIDYFANNCLLSVTELENGIHILDPTNNEKLFTIQYPLTWSSLFSVSRRSSFFAVTSDPSRMVAEIWDAESGVVSGRVTSSKPYTALSLSEDGFRLATGNLNGEVQILAVPDFDVVQSFDIQSRVTALTFSPTGNELAIGTDDHSFVIMDLQKERIVIKPHIQDQTVTDIVFHPEGNYVVTIHESPQKTFQSGAVWDIAEGWSRDIPNQSNLIDAEFIGDGSSLAVCDSAGRIQLLDVPSMRRALFLATLERDCYAIATAGDFSMLSGGSEGSINRWEKSHPAQINLNNQSRALRIVAFSPGGLFMAAAGIDSEIHLWNMQGETLSLRYNRHNSSASCVAFNPIRPQVASGDSQGNLHAWNPFTLETDWIVEVDPDTGIWWTAYSPDGKEVFAGCENGTLKVFQSISGNFVDSIRSAQPVERLDALAVSPDGKLVAFCDQGKSIRIWNRASGKEMAVLPANPNRCVAFSPDGKLLASANSDGTLTVWNMTSMSDQPILLKGHGGAATGVVFSADGTRLFSSSFDGTVKVWDPDKGTELLTLPISSGSIAWHVARNSNTDTLAACDDKGMITLWKLNLPDRNRHSLEY